VGLRQRIGFVERVEGLHPALDRVRAGDYRLQQLDGRRLFAASSAASSAVDW
jgi:hypothetical protein